MILTKEQHREATRTRDGGLSAISGAYALNTAHSIHHRRMRSQRGADTVENFLLLDGTGTTGDHGWVHGNTRIAYALGYLVPSWAEPDEWPVFRLDHFGTTRDWFMQTTDAQLEHITEARAAELNGYSIVDLMQARADLRAYLNTRPHR